MQIRTRKDVIAELAVIRPLVAKQLFELLDVDVAMADVPLSLLNDLFTQNEIIRMTIALYHRAAEFEDRDKLSRWVHTTAPGECNSLIVMLLGFDETLLDVWEQDRDLTHRMVFARDGFTDDASRSLPALVGTAITLLLNYERCYDVMTSDWIYERYPFGAQLGAPKMLEAFSELLTALTVESELAVTNGA
jgi:hypothetical protein